MRKSYRLLFIPLIIITSCISVKNNSSFKNETIFSIDGEMVPAEEFIYVYEKNNFNNEEINSQEDVLNYLDLFINFKLKVREARAEGVDTTNSFITEFNSYQSELIKPYLLDTKETDSLAWETYHRLQYFIHASHILVTVSENDDTTRAYQKIFDLQEQLSEGWDFNQLAKQASEDPSAKQNGGDLGLFTAMRMVYPFENAAYTTPVGQASSIFRTQFGYHILKVHEKIKNKGKIQIAHIVIEKTNADNENPEEKTFEIYDKLIAEGDWDYFCKEYSNDEQTKDKGGVLNYFGQGQLPANFSDFEKAVFDIDSINTIVGPIESPYGWHIVKLLDKKPLESFDELKESLKSQATRGERAEVKKEIVVQRLKSESGFTENKAILDLLINVSDSSFTSGHWSINLSDSILNSTLFSIDGDKYTSSEFVSFVKDTPNPNGPTSTYIFNQYEGFVNRELYKFEERRIEEEYIDYRMLRKEYYEGLMLFDIMEKYVWGKSAIDSTELSNFYHSNIDNYQWKERLNATIIHTNNSELTTSIEKELGKNEVIYFTSEIETKADTLNQGIRNLLEEIVSEFNELRESKLTILHDSLRISPNLISEIVERLSVGGITKKDIFIESTIDNEHDLKFVLSSSSPKVFEKLYNKNSQLEVSVQEGLFERGGKNILDSLIWKPGVYTLEDSTGSYVVKIKEVIPQEPKKLNEVRGAVISDYQKELEDKWIASLKQKYPAIKNEDVITKTLKYFERK